MLKKKEINEQEFLSKTKGTSIRLWGTKQMCRGTRLW